MMHCYIIHVVLLKLVLSKRIFIEKILKKCKPKVFGLFHLANEILIGELTFKVSSQCLIKCVKFTVTAVDYVDWNSLRIYHSNFIKKL